MLVSNRLWLLVVLTLVACVQSPVEESREKEGQIRPEWLANDPLSVVTEARGAVDGLSPTSIGGSEFIIDFKNIDWFSLRGESELAGQAYDVSSNTLCALLLDIEGGQGPNYDLYSTCGSPATGGEGLLIVTGRSLMVVLDVAKSASHAVLGGWYHEGHDGLFVLPLDGSKELTSEQVVLFDSSGERVN